MNILQEKWLNHQIVGLDMILTQDSVQQADITWIENSQFPQTYHKEYQLNCGEILPLTPWIEQQPDLWTDFQVNDQLEWAEGFIYCGEGEMGNEGFIAKTDKNNTLIWMLFSSSSNPFVHIVQDHDFIYIQSSHQFYVVLNRKNEEVFIAHEHP